MIRRVRLPEGDELVEAAKIIGLGTAAAVVYGILHDQITARLCVEYFTVAHPDYLNTTSPTLLGLFWGVVATCWAGAFSGGLLAIGCRAGRLPQLTWIDVRSWIAVLLVLMGIGAFIAGCVGYSFGSHPLPLWLQWVPRDFPEIDSPGKLPGFLAAGFAHNMSYNIGFAGTLTLMLLAFSRRRRLARTGSVVPKPSDIG